MLGVMGACAAPGMMDEKVGVIIAGLGVMGGQQVGCSVQEWAKCSE